ncbi:metalloregulator ArsR/SmtB family transcription factor [Salibacteraceae bacterium]|nr:metalloregulator ArsR/SmtB family transcription factor [Salibacteraceae bacterium]
MGITKTDLFTDVQNELALTAKALAHPARIAIIQHLVRANACINGEFVSELGLAQATVSQHLRELKDVGIIQGTIEGNSISYCINPKRWSEIKGLLNTLFDQYENGSNGNCC